LSLCVSVTLQCTLRLGGDVPVEICGDESNWEETAEVLDDTFLGDAEIRR